MNPIVSQWLTRPGGLSTRLRSLRERTGMSGKDFAARLGWDPTRLSKIERGAQMPKAPDVRAIVEAAGAQEVLDELLDLMTHDRTPAFAFGERMSGGQEAVQRSYTELVANATVVRHIEVAYIPGLLQVPAYMQRALGEQVTLRRLAIDDVAEAVKERQRRQAYLSDPTKRFEFLLTEAVLRQPLCPASVMRDQFERLLEVEAADNVRLGIIPQGPVLPTTPQGKLEAYDDYVVIEHYYGEQSWDGDEGARWFLETLIPLLWLEAVEGDEARQLITQAIDSLRQ